MSNAEYNEAQFEIEKAEAVKEARNNALEEAAKEVESDPEHTEDCPRCGEKFFLKRDERLVHDTHAEYAHKIHRVIQHPHVWAARIRALKTLMILLPLLFVFGVAAGEPDRVEPRRVPKTPSEVAYWKYQSLKLTWMYRRGGLSESGREQLLADYIAAQKEYRRLLAIEMGR